MIYRIVNKDGLPWCNRKFGFYSTEKHKIYRKPSEADIDVQLMTISQFNQVPRLQQASLAWENVEEAGSTVNTHERIPKSNLAMPVSYMEVGE